ncbi:MarR family winged helix-turn-helix transcriptional regulator [Egicoccus sp. AB-alg2]|uniref:MarR family winged helix-turn-helix transcriptional regulator n=1 Tax=Egicoccus sp. AB-alg2 TaxID=3242693 RepID=UPI00359D6230
MPSPLPPGRLAAELLLASRWFDDALRARLAAEGWPPVTPTRSRAFLAMSGGPARISDLARELDITRQAAHQLVDGLEADGLVTRRPDPTDRRAQTVDLTTAGRDLARAAGRILPALEHELSDRIGSDAVAALRDALARDRGPAPG